MSANPSVEEIARAAVALCADLLGRYQIPGQPGFTGARTGYTRQERLDEWGRRVLAWQEQLNQPAVPQGSQNPFVRPGDPEPQPCRRTCPPNPSDDEHCLLWPSCTSDLGEGSAPGGGDRG